jgi:hypothetical protein
MNRPFRADEKMLYPIGVERSAAECFDQSKITHFATRVRCSAFAGQTQIWTQGEYADFERGVIKTFPCAATACCRWRRTRANCSTLRGLPLGAGAGFQGQPLHRRRHGRQAVPHSAGRPGQDGGGSGRARNPRHRGGFQGPRLLRHRARRQGLSHDGQRQTGSFLRSQGQIHLGAGLQQQGRSAGGHRRIAQRPGRDSRVAPDGKGGLLQERRDHVRSMAVDAERQPDCGHRAGRPGAAHFARRAKASCSTRCPRRK